MSAVFEKPLLIEIKHSRQLNVLLFSIHAVTMASVVLYTTLIFIKLGFALLIAASYIHYRKKISIFTRIVMKKDNEWDLFTSSGEQYIAHLTGNSYVSRHIVILGFELEQEAKNVYVCLMRDSMNKATSCGLRSRLKLFSKPGRT